MLLSMAYRLGRRVLDVLGTAARSDGALTGPSWKQLLTLQAKTVIATDLFHVDTALLTRVYVLVFNEHRTRRIHLAGPEDRLWLNALASLIPRRRWAEVFPVSPTTLLTGTADWSPTNTPPPRTGPADHPPEQRSKHWSSG
jgi:hypothetical protein